MAKQCQKLTKIRRKIRQKLILHKNAQNHVEGPPIPVVFPYTTLRAVPGHLVHGTDLCMKIANFRQNTSILSDFCKHEIFVYRKNLSMKGIKWFSGPPSPSKWSIESVKRFVDLISYFYRCFKIFTILGFCRLFPPLSALCRGETYHFFAIFGGWQLISGVETTFDHLAYKISGGYGVMWCLPHFYHILFSVHCSVQKWFMVVSTSLHTTSHHFENGREVSSTPHYTTF